MQDPHITIQCLTNSVQRLTRENHKHLETLKVVAQDANRMRDALAVAQANLRIREAEIRRLEDRQRETRREAVSEAARRVAAEGALQALSASKIRWGTLALGWCLGAATVLAWAFW